MTIIEDVSFPGPGKPQGQSSAPAESLPHGVQQTPMTISFSNIISALTFAIDLTEGAVPGHALRTCILGMRLAHAANIPQDKLPALYYGLLLKDVGCSSNAARLCEIFGGNDVELKNGVKLVPPGNRSFSALRTVWNQVLPQESILERVVRVGKILLHQRENTASMIATRCDRGASIVRKLGLSLDTAAAIYSLDEHWDGGGFPNQLSGSSIPLFARILAIAQHLDIYASERGCDVALAELRERSGRWFDPSLVRLVLSLAHTESLWAGCLPTDDDDEVRALALAFEPETPADVGADAIDRICEAFADVVDAKSPFTYRHSLGVAEVATALAETLELPAEDVQTVRRAALLHDLGKLGIPNTILDKPGHLTREEWLRVVEHPRLTQQILSRIGSFEELARIAGAHHEKLDGTGYPDNLRGAEISPLARIVAVADCYQAVTEKRPYRESVSHQEAMKMLERLTPDKLDATCVEALGRMRKRSPEAETARLLETRLAAVTCTP